MRKFLALVLVTMLVSLVGATTSAGAAAPTKDTNVISPGVAAKLATLGSGEQMTVIITLSDQADLSALPGASRAARSSAAIRALQAKASASQMPVTAFLRARTAQHKVTEFRSFWIFDGLAVTATADVIEELAARSDVASVTLDEITIVPTYGPAQPNLTLVQAPSLWNQGYTGGGVVVASLDSGVDVNHPDLASRWRGGTNSWFDPYGQHQAYPVDLSGHGTGTMGVMVGGDSAGTSIGVAPGASWIAARIFDDRGRSTASAIHSAFQWVLDPDGDPTTLDSPQVVNNSWSFGSGGGCNLEFQPDLQALRSAGIVPVFAAGNFGSGSSTSSSPANYPEALAVGAVDNGDLIAYFSSRGPSSCGESSTTFPEIVAPGVSIKTSDRYGLFQYASGTSLASPHVAGAIALLLSADSAWTAGDAEQAILATAVDLGSPGPDNTFGKGRLDIAAAYQWLLNPPTTTTTSPTTTSSTTTSSTTTSSTTTSSTTTSSTTTSSTTTSSTTTTMPATTTTTLPPTSGLFSDGFDDGSLTAWSAASTNGGKLSATRAAALNSSAYGLQAVISNRNSMYVADWSPVASSVYGARFMFDPNGTSIPSRQVHDLFVGSDGSGTVVFRVQIQSGSNGYEVRGRAISKRGREQSTAWVPLTDGPHSISVDWVSSSSGTNGSFILSIDGAVGSTAGGLTNGPYRVDEVRLGPQGIGKNIQGTEYFDNFVTIASS